MSAIERNSASTPAHTSERKPRITVAQLFLRAVHRWQRNRSINALSRLDDWQLEDIGISRNDIPRVVEGLIVPEDPQPKSMPKAPEPGKSCPRAA